MNYHLSWPPLCRAVTPLYQVTGVYAALGEPLSHFRRRGTFLSLGSTSKVSAFTL